MAKNKVRLFVDQPMAAGQALSFDRDQSNYLFNVMRLGIGAEIEVFNGTSGGWLAQITSAGKRGGAAVITQHIRPHLVPPDLWLLFAPIKKARTDFIVEKAAEMGVRRICPVRTRFTNSERLRTDRLQAHAIEAAEQCGGTFVPQVDEIAPLETLLRDWPAERQLIFCDEARVGEAAGLADLSAPAALLIGPEGGFSDEERAMITRQPNARVMALGPRILRADTAVVAALTLWQMGAGDWR